MTEVARLGLRQVKLYFMVGLPGEITADIEEMIDLTLRCKAILDGGQTGCRLTLNVSPFVPKAGTPFQRQPMASLAVLGERLSRLKKALVPRGVRVKGESPAWSQVQGVLARGDARVGQAIAAVGELSLAGWRRAVETCQLDIDAYLYRGWETGARLPWDVRDLGQGGPFNAGRAAR